MQHMRGADQDNALSYELFLPGLPSDDELQNLSADCLARILPHTSGYIWQGDPFRLLSSTQQASPWSRRATSDLARRRTGSVACEGRQGTTAAGQRQSPAASTVGEAERQQQAPAADLPPHLWGFLSFGDNLEDEWFATWLLLELTRQVPGLTARAWDNDGEFHLIEAAYALPKWVKPESSTNRVWLHNGALHLVPLPSARFPTLPPAPSAAEALAIVAADSVPTKAGDRVQSALAAKLQGYPARAQQEMHRACAKIPARVAAVLAQEPQLVAAAVATFHYRDVDDMKAAARMQHFPPQDWLTGTIKLSRCLYAMVAQQRFAAPKGFPMPLPTSPDFAAAELGMKLTCGFEMVAAAAGAADQAAQSTADRQSPEASCAAAQSRPAWASYRASLERNNYFQGNIEGSERHRELLDQAVRAFLDSASTEGTSIEHAGARMLQLAQQPPDRAAIEKALAGPEDSTAWMTSGAADLERELAQRQQELSAETSRHAGRTAAELGADAATAGGFNADDLTGPLKVDAECFKVTWNCLLQALQHTHHADELTGQLDSSAFVETMSGLEGAEVPAQPGMDFSEAGFLQELQAALGVPKDQAAARLHPGLDGKDSDNASDSLSDDMASMSGSSDVEHEERFQAAQTHGSARAQPGIQGSSASGLKSGKASQHNWDQRDMEWEARTATDSDDESLSALDDRTFMSQYDEALGGQLSGTTLGQTFASDEGKLAKAGPQQEEELQPVDVDMNLVESMLQSYTAQQGLPGPASNLAGMLGLQLPDNADEQ